MSTLDEQIAADTAAQIEAIDQARTESVNLGLQVPFADPPETVTEPSEQKAETETATDATEAVKEAPEPSETDNEDSDVERFKRVRREATEAKRRTRELEARLAAIEAGDPNAIDSEALNQRAAQMASEKLFNDECDKIAVQGKKAFPDFNEALTELWSTLGQFHPALVEAAIEAGEPHKLLHFLGTNTDEAERIANLPAARQGVALAKIAQKLNAPPPPKPVSKAPPPITPVSGATSPPIETDIMKLSFAEFEKQEQKKRHERLFGA